MVRTLSKLSELRESRFGQPFPRHGLSLLWWFANDCVDIDRNGRIFTRYNPEDGYFGFHTFHNIERLLPQTYLTYYEVGNLSHRHHPQHALPRPVTKNYDPNVPDSNTDRIIVLVHSSQNKVWLDKIYVTKHSDQTRFDQNRTYLMKREIIEDIKNLKPGEFLSQMKNDQNSLSIQVEPYRDSTHIEPFRDSTHIEPFRDSTHIEPFRDSTHIEPFRDSTHIEPFRDSTHIEPFRDSTHIVPFWDSTTQQRSTEDGCKECCCLIGCALILAIIIIFIMLFFYT